MKPDLLYSNLDYSTVSTGASTASMPTLDEMMEAAKRLQQLKAESDARIRETLKDIKCELCDLPVELTDRGGLRMCGHILAVLRERFPPQPSIRPDSMIDGGYDRMWGMPIELHGYANPPCDRCHCGEPITQDFCPRCGTWHDIHGRR